MKSTLLKVTLALAALGSSGFVLAADETFTWSCGESHQFKTTGGTENLVLTWDSKNYEMRRETSLPGSLRYKNTNSGFDLVVLQNKAMLFNMRSGTRLADSCQTAEMRTGKLPHLFAGAEPFTPGR
ncbi:hypothetical protein AOC06_04200 [Polynucleobacter paludilacus]|uniref:hypothetical protein n=1 Tax=Polynucleobacter paludilacus TaxID=1855895 RepID=UPI001BFE5451|nr:hypothetical protein [Polynucleobacter paludilacus]QWD87777.1 hypothetical protein AOC06_04200 [Polynucleobacter paludilacus]